MTPALRWASLRAMLMFSLILRDSHKTVSADRNLWRERRAEAESNRAPAVTAGPNRLTPVTGNLLSLLTILKPTQCWITLRPDADVISAPPPPPPQLPPRIVLGFEMLWNGILVHVHKFHVIDRIVIHVFPVINNYVYVRISPRSCEPFERPGSRTDCWPLVVGCPWDQIEGEEKKWGAHRCTRRTLIYLVARPVEQVVWRWTVSRSWRTYPPPPRRCLC